MLRRLCPSRGEDGFSLIEAMAALMVLAFVMIALATAMISGFRALQETKGYQQATSLARDAVESGRDITYDELSMVVSDLVGDPRITGAGSCPTASTTGLYFFDPDGAGDLGCEEVVTSASGGAIDQHLTTETVGGKNFSVARYVTWVDDSDQGGDERSYKRLVTIVEWSSGGQTRRYQASTLIANRGEGVTLTEFELSPSSQLVSTAPGSSAVFPHTIRNLGAADSFDLRLPSPAGRSWSFSFYEDVNENGGFDAAVDVALTDTNGDGAPNTRSVDTDETLFFVAVLQLGPTELPGSEPMTLQASSVRDPNVIETATDTLEVQVQLSDTQLYLHNNPTPPSGHTTAQANLTMNGTGASAGTLYRYSTNYINNSSNPGRYVAKGGTATSSDTKTMVNWVYQAGQEMVISGDGELRVYVAAKDLRCNKSVGFTARLRDKTSSMTTAGTVFATVSKTVAAPGGGGTCDFRLITLDLPDLNWTVLQNHWVELKITVNSSPGTETLFAYDTTGFPSVLKLPAGS